MKEFTDLHNDEKSAWSEIYDCILNYYMDVKSGSKERHKEHFRKLIRKYKILKREGYSEFDVFDKRSSRSKSFFSK